MQITLICVGKVKETFFRKLITDMEYKIKKRCSFSICELSDLPIAKNAGQKEEQRVIEQEGKDILRHIPADAYVIALCINGKELSSADHKRLIRQIEDSGKDHIVYIIGGSLGLSDEVVKRADYRLSFSKMTFPHQLMRVMLLEELNHLYL